MITTNISVAYSLGNLCHKPVLMDVLYSYDVIQDDVFVQKKSYDGWTTVSYDLYSSPGTVSDSYTYNGEPTINNQYSLLSTNEVANINLEEQNKKANISWDGIVNMPQLLEQHKNIVADKIQEWKKVISNSTNDTRRLTDIQQLTLKSDASELLAGFTGIEASIITNINQQLAKLLSVRLNKQVYEYIEQNTDEFVTTDIAQFLTDAEEVERAFYFDAFDRIITPEHEEHFHLLVDIINGNKFDNSSILFQCATKSLSLIYKSNRSDKDKLIASILSDKNIKKYIRLLKKKVGKSVNRQAILNCMTREDVNDFISHVPKLYTFAVNWYKSILALEDIVETNTSIKVSVK